MSNKVFAIKEWVYGWDKKGIILNGKRWMIKWDICYLEDCLTHFFVWPHNKH